MKKFLMVMAFLFSFTSLFAQEEETIVFTEGVHVPRTYTITKDKISIYDEETETTEELDRSRFFLGEDKFYHFINKNDMEEIALFCNHSSVDFYPLEVDGDPETVRISEWQTEFRKTVQEYNMYPAFRDYETKYSASSELKEKNTKYVAENLGTFFLPPADKGSTSSWDTEHKPWVEGAKGYGINQFIKVKTNSQFSGLAVVNGYVDFYRRDLYKKNSRVKTFRVKDLDNKLEYDINLDDAVYVQCIKLKKPTKNIILYIKEVYKGDKWDDTCVSCLVPTRLD